MKRSLKFLAALALGSLLSAPVAVEARIYINIDSPEGGQLPLAIAPMKTLDSSVAARGDLEGPLFQQYRAVLERDLRMTGLFRMIHPDSFLESPDAGISPDETDFSLWKKSGADALVKAGIKKKGDSYALEIRLFDVFQQTAIVGKRYTFKPNDFSTVLHSFADQIIQALTGEAGVFASTRILCVGSAGRNKEAYVMDVDGSHLEQVTHHQSLLLSPEWSRDGRYVGYTSFASSNPDLYLLDRRTRREQKISAKPGLNFGVSFAPHRDWLALAVSNNSDQELLVLNYRGEIMKTVTENTWIDIEPTWSPDGRMIAFVSNRSGQPHIYRVNADGSEVERLTYKGFHNVSPAWSPKGDKIAFAGRDQGYFDLFIMNPDGSNIQRLTRKTRNNEAPAWSPNGQMIAFQSDRTGKNQIYVMGLNGVGQTQISDGGGKFENPAWSPRLKDLNW